MTLLQHQQGISHFTGLTIMNDTGERIPHLNSAVNQLFAGDDVWKAIHMPDSNNESMAALQS